ncbi:MAG: hypothetical protein AAGB10_00755 [Pseudomonadota bacterium]
MTDQPQDLAERAMIRRKREDMALAVPTLGIVLLITPVLNIFTGIETLFGVPAIYAYVFLIWAGLTILTRSLARRLMGAGDKRS